MKSLFLLPRAIVSCPALSRLTAYMKTFRVILTRGKLGSKLSSARSEMFQYQDTCFRLFSLLLVCHSCVAKKYDVIIGVNAPIHITHPLSPSVAGGLTIFEYGWINYFNDTKFMKLAQALGPSYFRIGGTKCDVTNFVPDVQVSKATGRGEAFRSSCTPQERDDAAFDAFRRRAVALQEALIQEKLLNGVKSTLKPITMTASEWRQLNDFCKCVGWKLIFDLNIQTRDGNRWNSSNAELLLNYSANKYKIDWELGNEPNSYHHKGETALTADEIAEGFERLRNLLRSSDWWRTSKIFGPDVNNIGKRHSKDYMSTFLQTASDAINGVTFHQYYLHRRTAAKSDFTNPDILNSIIDEVEPMVNIIKQYAPTKQVWLGETASASGGGAPGLSNSFLDGFLWLDKLGITAKLGVDMVVRQTFVVSNYALLDSSFDPTPDYWLTLMYKTLVGHQVLNVTLVESTPRNGNNHNQKYLRMYAHCTSSRSRYKRGSVVLYFINLASRTYRLVLESLQGTTSKAADLYLLEPAIAGNLTSTQTKLNGVTLQLGSDFSIPPLSPRKLHRKTLQRGVSIPAHSYGFLVLQDTAAPACNVHQEYAQENSRRREVMVSG